MKLTQILTQTNMNSFYYYQFVISVYQLVCKQILNKIERIRRVRIAFAHQLRMLGIMA